MSAKDISATVSLAPRDDVQLTRRELATRWRISIESLKRKEKARILPALKLGRLVRYRLSDILAIEAAARV